MMQQQSSSRPSSRPQVRLLNLILGDATEERDPVLISHSSSAGRAWKILQRAGAFIAPLIMMTPSSCAALRTRRTGADNRKTARERMLPQASNCWICSGLTARRWPTSQICFVNRPSPKGRETGLALHHSFGQGHVRSLHEKKGAKGFADRTDSPLAAN